MARYYFNNLIIGDSENIRVYLRIRPFIDREDNNVNDIKPVSSIQILASDEYQEEALASGAGTSVKVLDSRHNSNLLPGEGELFTFDAVGGPEVEQSTIFDQVAKPIAENCLLGYNGTIFAYGQTGSGKTFTMQGPINEDRSIDYNQRGVIPRTFEYLFQRIREEEKKSNGTITFVCKCSYVEIYNEYVYDLLELVRSASPTGCILREDGKKGVWVEGCREEIVHDVHDAMLLYEEGSRNRHVAETAMNRESSRSHCVFTITVQSKKLDGAIFDVREARFNLVDLAGSERQQLAVTGGARLKEAGNINKSLLALSNVINALVDIANGKNRHVHYRDSKLTFLLRDSLGGNAKTLIIAAVSPSPLCLAETLSTLRFARRAKQIRNKAIVNKDVQGNIFELQAEVKRLRQENLVLKSASPTSNDAIVLNSTGLNADGANGDSFIWTMHYKRLRDLQAQVERLCKQLESTQVLLTRREDQLKNERMILKFRDGTIQKYERDLAKKICEQGDLASQELLELFAYDRTRFRQELSALREQVEKNPELLKYRSEANQLIQRVKSLELLTGGSEAQIKELCRFNDELYRKLAEAEDQIQKTREERRPNEDKQSGSREILFLNEDKQCGSREIPFQAMSRERLKDEDNDTMGDTSSSDDFANNGLHYHQLKQLISEKRDLEDRYEDLLQEMEILRNDKRSEIICHDNGTDYDETMSGGEDGGKKRRTSDASFSNSRDSIAVEVLKLKIEQLEADHEKLQRTLQVQAASLREELHHQQVIAGDRKTTIEHLTEELRQVKGGFEDLLAKHETLRTANAHDHATIKSLEIQIERLIERLEPFEALSSYGYREASEIARRLDQCNQLETRLSKAEFDLSSAQHDNEDLLNQIASITANQSAEQLKEAQEAMITLQTELDDVRAELVRVQQENEKLIQHRNIKQKLQYHVAIKEENNAFREEIRQLREELTRLRQRNIELEEIVQQRHR